MILAALQAGDTRYTTVHIIVLNTLSEAAAHRADLLALAATLEATRSSSTNGALPSLSAVLYIAHLPSTLFIYRSMYIYIIISWAWQRFLGCSLPHPTPTPQGRCFNINGDETPIGHI